MLYEGLLMQVHRLGGEWLDFRLQRLRRWTRWLAWSAIILALAAGLGVAVRRLADEQVPSVIEAAIALLVGGAVLAALLAVGLLARSVRYRKGLRGERLVAEDLMVLDDRYHLFNDVLLAGHGGNIDHVIVGPTGLFVVETKHYSGRLVVAGDDWERYYPPRLGLSLGGRLRWKRASYFPLKSASRQAKANAVALRRFLQARIGYCPWVTAVVALSNPRANLRMERPGVPVLRCGELSGFIAARHADGRVADDLVAHLVVALETGLADGAPYAQGNCPEVRPSATETRPKTE